MKKTGMTVLATFGFVLSVAAQLSIRPIPQNTDTNHWWMQRFNEKQKIVREGGAKVVFLGDSITHFWEWESNGLAQWKKYFAGEPYRALNLGFTADRTEHVLWRIENGEFDGYSPKAIVLMIGTNNHGQRPDVETPADTVLGIRAILNALQRKVPSAKIILMPIFPRGEKPTDVHRIHNEIVNNAIRGFADDEKILWCDINNQLPALDGTLTKEMMPDYLHPSAPGYEIWAKAVIPFLNLCLKDDKPEPRTVRPLADLGEKKWRAARLALKRSQICKDPDHSFDIVLFGDSITHGWEGVGYKTFVKYLSAYDVMNIGYSGDRTEHLVWRAQNGELDGYKAKMIMLMIGTNNKDPAPDVAAGIRKILDIIAQKQPTAQTLLLPIFPRGEQASHCNRIKNNMVNELIRKFADGKKVIWFDISPWFLNADGSMKTALFGSDYLHPNAAGYEVWAKAVLPYFKTACGK